MVSAAAIKPMVKSKSRDFINLRPLPCSGLFAESDTERHNAIFLGPEKMVIQQREDGKCIAREIMPINIREDYEPALIASMRLASDPLMKVYKTWSGQVITDRTGGFYDHLEYTLRWANQPYVKRDIYELLHQKGSCESPYHGIIAALQKTAGLVVKGLFLEIADAPTPTSYTLGATVLIVKEEYAQQWKLSAMNFTAIRKAMNGSNEAQLVKCHIDELMGLAFADPLLPVLVPTAVYEGSKMDGLVAPIQAPQASQLDEGDEEDDEDEDDEDEDNEEEEVRYMVQSSRARYQQQLAEQAKQQSRQQARQQRQAQRQASQAQVKEQQPVKLQILAPYFSTPYEAFAWREEQERRQQEKLTKLQAGRGSKQAANTKKAQDITTAKEFLILTYSEKRAILRATGILPQVLPRLREGKRAVDAMLIPLLDEEVAYEVLRRLAETRGDYELAAQMEDYESRKPLLAREIRLARERGDHALAKQYCEELNSLSMLTFNPTVDSQGQAGPGQVAAGQGQGQQMQGGGSVGMGMNAKEGWDVEEWYWEQRKRIYSIVAW